jgi:hypothetical protein
MRQIRSLLQTYIVILLGICHFILITRFVTDFLGTDKGNIFLGPVVKLSDLLIAPFVGMFESPEADGSMINYTVLSAIITYTCIWIICFAIIRIFFKEELSKKSLKLANLFFSVLEGILIFRSVLVILEIDSSTFSKIINAFSNILILPIDLISSLTGELVIELEIVIAMFLLAIVWITIYKILEGITESAEKMPQAKPIQREFVQPVITEVKEQPEPQVEPQVAEEVEVPEVAPEKSSQETPTERKTTPKKPKVSVLEKVKKVKKSIDKMIMKDVEEEIEDPFKDKSKDSSESRKSPLA